MLFSMVFQLYHTGRCTYSCFPEFFLPILCTIFFPSHWLPFNVTIEGTIDSGKRGTTIINIWKENLAEPGIEPATLCLTNLICQWQSYGAQQKKVVCNIIYLYMIELCSMKTGQNTSVVSQRSPHRPIWFGCHLLIFRMQKEGFCMA